MLRLGFPVYLVLGLCSITPAGEPPIELSSSPWPGEEKVLLTDTKQTWLTFSTGLKEIEFFRMQRETSDGEWTTQKHVSSVSFFPLDAQCWCDEELFVTGVYRNGLTTIERWTIHHPADHDETGQYIPLKDRPFPRIERDVILQTRELGHIRTITPDPQRRFLLAVTHEEPRLIRINLPSGEWTVLHDAESLPALAQVYSIYTLRHVVDGLTYRLSSDSPTHQRDLPPGWAPSIVLLNDADEDGQLDAPVSYTPAQWVELGYTANAWVDPCQ